MGNFFDFLKMTMAKGEEAEKLLNEVMNSTLDKMVKFPEKMDVYLKAFKMVLDVDFVGMNDEAKSVLSEYLWLKQKLVKVEDKEEE